MFTGSALKGCRNFELPGGRARHLVLQHFGEDGWIPSFVRIILDDHTHLLCRDGQVREARWHCTSMDATFGRQMTSQPILLALGQPITNARAGVKIVKKKKKRNP